MRQNWNSPNPGTVKIVIGRASSESGIWWHALFRSRVEMNLAFHSLRRMSCMFGKG